MFEKFLDVNEIWNLSKGLLKEKLSGETYRQWFQSIVPLSTSGDEIVLGVSDDFFADWLREHYLDILKDAVGSACGKALDISFESGHAAVEDKSPAVEEVHAKSQGGKVLSPASSAAVSNAPNCMTRFTFENFVVGEENRYAFAASQAVAKKPGIYNPLYVYGGTGMGKTHLLQAVANEIIKANPDYNIEYVTCEALLNAYVDSLKMNKYPEFRNRFRSADVLLIDDVHQLAGKERLQEEFFNLFNTLYNSNKQLIFTSDKQPCDIQGLEERIVSRFESGVTTEITMPGIETRLAILKMKQKDHLLKLEDEILYFIASRIGSSVRRLEGAHFRLVAYCSVMGNEKISIQKAEELLGSLFDEEASSRRITIENIQKKVAEHFDIRVNDILGKKRPKNIAEPRMIAMYLSRKMTEHSLPEIGMFFGKNHVTVLHAVSKIESECRKNETMKRTVSTLQKQLQG